MIYLDVTGSCKSAKNTGIQRTTRNIFRGLNQRDPVLPISWNLIGNCYQKLGERELQILQEPFRALGRSTARPELRGEHVLAELQRLFSRPSVQLRKITRDDVLFVPDNYQDGRLDYLPEVIRTTGARSVAIFYDAAALRLQILRTKKRHRFEKYIDSLAAFHLVICISRDSQEHLHELWREHGVEPTETCVESLPLDDFDPEERQPRIGGKASSTPIILCVSTFEPRKNHLTLLRAAETLWQEGRSFELQLIGRSTGSYGRKIIPQIRRLQKRGCAIRWLQHVTDDNLHEGYRTCRFTVYPSVSEGFGLPIAESLWHGRPCVCGRNGALGEIAGEGGCLLVDQTDPDALADAMRILLTDRTTYEELSARARAREFRTWTDYVDKLQEHLKAAPVVPPV